ncbi:WD40 repeat-like protein [Rhizopogon vinicolor AM-OR11-026]|uniref:WD40 repeat-like protein n=1 Tax=Rhizopogon vinicolor AM-OR11-026 TaxID=1314800 RepID=A0A1B7MWG5_9AGAM|nr:WD40 repeat-like protein [Rhizopogon vinicolor AM-OR11-026]
MHQDPVKTFDGHEDHILSIATFPDGKRIATGSQDKTIRIWRLLDGREMKKWTGRVIAGPLDGHTNMTIALDISLDGGILVSGSIDRTVLLWDTTTWQRKGLPLDCHEDAIISIATFPDGKRIATGSWDETIRIWRLADGREMKKERLAQFKGHRDANFNNSWNWSLTWTRDGTHILSVGDEDDPIIRSWDTSTLKQAGNSWTGHDKIICNIILNPAGTLLALASEDHTVRLWQLSTGTEVARYQHSELVFRVAFSVDGRFMFSGGRDDKISQWEISEDSIEIQQDPVKTFEGHEDLITSIATFPDGKRIVTGSVDKTIRLWVRDVETGRVVAGPLDGHTNPVLALDISLDGGILASGSWDRTVILWDTTTWQTKGQPLEYSADVTWVQFSPTGQLGVATEEDIQIWDSDRRECLAQFNGHAKFNNSCYRSLTWTRDGTHILSADMGDHAVIRSWDTSTLKPASNPWTGHDDIIHHIILNPAGTLLASASEDHTVRLWQLSTGIEVARYEHSDDVFRVAFSVDGHFIFSGCDDGKISQWEIPEDVLIAASSDSLADEPKTKVIISNCRSLYKLTSTHARLVLHGENKRHVFTPR